MQHISTSRIFVKISVILLLIVLLIIGSYGFYSHLANKALKNSSKVIALAFASKDTIAVASRHRVDLFDIETRKILKTFEVNTDITAIQFSPDGSYLAVARDAVINFWAIDQGKEIKHLRVGLDFPKSLSFSPDGKILAVGHIGHHGDASIHLVLVEKREPVTEPVQGYRFALFSQDGNWLAAIPAWHRFRQDGCGIEMLKVENIQGEYNIKCDKILARDLNRFEEYSPEKMIRRVTSITLTSDAKILASIQKDDNHLIRIWSLETCQELRKLEGHEAEVTSIAFSPDGKLLASAGEDGQILLWSVETGNQVETKWTHLGKVNCVAFSPDGKFLASGGNDCQVKFWEISKLAGK